MYILEILHGEGVAVKSGVIKPELENSLRFWTGVNNHEFSGECVVMGDVTTITEFVRVFDADHFSEIESRWRGPERCRLVIRR